jgi:hypothetical protein
MIIKSKGYRSQTAVKNVLKYVLNEAKISDESESFLLTRYLVDTSSIENIVGEFEAQEALRKAKRKNVNRVYQDIISFHKEDSILLEDQKLRALAREYIEKRAPQSQALVVKHKDKDHVHLHFVISGLTYCEGTSNRLDRGRFNQIKLEMERYQDRNLGLKHSRVDHSGTLKLKSSTSPSDWSDEVRQMFYSLTSWDILEAQMERMAILIFCMAKN